MTEKGGLNINGGTLSLRFVVLLLRGRTSSSAPVSSSRPSPCLSPLEYRIKQPGEPFIPNRMPPLVTAERLQRAAHRWQSLTNGVKVNTLASCRSSDTRGGSGEKVTRKNGIMKDTACLR
ncbi:hypothetical protein PBY51_014077 [Eleginops maclovinus]|uniref:Uncharacterized protein n=1 Tax=Eleginops maclovinus TaxID=56733 RepID=A0AAN7WVZ0_ELEMC|nr:hypothetical protein PBY51_014077 [Eleginops maclovinus]